MLCSSLAWLDKKKNINPLDHLFDLPNDEDDLKKPSSSSCSNYNDGDDDDFVSIHKKPVKGDKKEKKEKKKNAWATNTTQILYSSRTHAQLSQACKEMKRTAYSYMHGLVIGGRDNLCINEEVLVLETTSAKNQNCRARVHAKQCQYHTNFEKKVMTTVDFTTKKILDMEDLIELGRKHQVCPYYATRVLMTRADVIFAPYNYILDPTTRTAVGIELEDNVVIIDEGHNIEKVCEDSVSCELKSETLEDLDSAIAGLQKYLEFNGNDSLSEDAMEALQAISPDDVRLLHRIVKNLYTEITATVQEGPDDKRMHPQEWIFDLLKKVKLDLRAKKLISHAIEDIENYIIITSLSNSASVAFSGNLTRIKDFLTILYPEEYEESSSWEEFRQEFIKKYRVFTQIEEDEDKITPSFNKRFKGFQVIKKKSHPMEKKKWTLHLWCLSASIALKSMQKLGAHSILITSGTLAPLNSFQIELELPFPITLQNLHVVSPDQISVYIVKSAWNGITFNTSYMNRENMDHIRTLGQSIAHFIRLIPNGVLLFFPSYAVMNSLIKTWRDKDSDWKVHSLITQAKQIFIEPQGKAAFNECIQKYKEKIDTPKSKGAIFMAVCRGKLSEGIDLADQYCRGVIMVGLPFPATQDPRVIIKKKYLDEMKVKELSSQNWYTLQMKRALNQAIGRIVRNRHDYGVVMLLDHRFPEHVSGLSRWMQKYVQVKCYADAAQSVTEFFNIKKNCLKSIENDDLKPVIKKEGLKKTEKENPSSKKQFSETITLDV